jgi:hypothetical protein
MKIIINSCTCTSKKDIKKNLYRSEMEAQEQIDYAFQTRGVALSMYSCPEADGWHLTSG